MSKRRKECKDDEFKFFRGDVWYEHIADSLVLIIASVIGISFFFIWIIWPFLSFLLFFSGGMFLGIFRSIPGFL